MRLDIVSDTHGYLSQALLDQLQGADLIVHAGDICSESDYRTLNKIAFTHACRGNNDWGFEYDSFVTPMVRFFAAGLRWEVCHYRERLDLKTCDVAICGHTHRPFVTRDEATGVLVMNPGSPTFPRAGGPTMGRIVVEDGKVTSAKIIELDEKSVDWG